MESAPPAKRTRIRIPKSCIPCLKGKRACDRERPACGRCVKAGHPTECLYDPRLETKSSSRTISSANKAAASASASASTHKRSHSDAESSEDSDNDSRVNQLQAELDETKRQMRILQQMLANQQPRNIHSSHPTAHTITSPPSGLHMLAEMAGPDPASGFSKLFASSSTSAPSSSSSSSLAAAALAASPSTSTASQSPAGRSDNSMFNSDARSTSSHPSSVSLDNPAPSPRNMNGAPIYYGASANGDKVLRKVTADSAPKRDVQTAFNGVLDPSRDHFPFATIWSSGNTFIDEVLPFFPRPDEFDSICQSFVRHFSAMCPALTIPHAVAQAREFSRLSRVEQANTSLPWLAVFFMICAMGKNCDLEKTVGALEIQIQRYDSLHAGSTSSSSQQPEPDADCLPVLRRLHQSCRSPARMSDIFLSAAYQCLRLCSFLSSPTLQTIHAQLLMGAYMLNTERAASFWPLLGSVARQAQSIGLHVDPDKMRQDCDPLEADIRRRLWWAIVHQDVILSGIFGRPLGITRFSAKFPAASEPNARNFATLQCEFSQLARTYLDENQDNNWTREQVDSFTGKVFEWYAQIPRQYRAELGLGSVEPFGSAREEEAFTNYTVAGVDLSTKGLMEVQQSCNLAIEVHHVLLSLHRSSLLSAEEDETSTQVNQASLAVCARCVRAITRAQQVMMDTLGRSRASMFWKISYYTYQAAVSAAYLVFLDPRSRLSKGALDDLGVLSDVFERMPDRWTGLKAAKDGLRVLHKLAMAARDNPQAASMPRPAHSVAVLTPLPVMADVDPFALLSQPLIPPSPVPAPAPDGSLAQAFLDPAPPADDMFAGLAVQPNSSSKDMANYWSEYFSLQLDWNRLNTLA